MLVRVSLVIRTNADTIVIYGCIFLRTYYSIFLLRVLPNVSSALFMYSSYIFIVC